MKKVDIYTDGACSGNPGAGGYGVVLIFNGIEKEISEGYRLTTNNRMEIMAVIVGLKSLKEACEVTVYSDSKYVVDTIEKGWLANWVKKNWTRGKNEKVLNRDLWEEMLGLIQFHTVKFVWVKGHASNVYNNRCDLLATSAINNKDLLCDINYENMK